MPYTCYTKYRIAGIFRPLELSRFAESRIFAIKNFANCGKQQFLGEAGGLTYYNALAVNDERELIGANKMNELERYEVETVDRGYRVYLAV